MTSEAERMGANQVEPNRCSAGKRSSSLGIQAGAYGEKAVKYFAISAAGMLTITGLAKVGMAFGSARALDVADPIIGMAFRWLLPAAGVLELIVALLCLETTSRRFSLVLLAWLSTVFLVYRLGLRWMGWKGPCGCLGHLADALHLSPHTADAIMKGVLAYLFLGSCLSLAWEQARRKRGQQSNENVGPMQSQ